MTTCLRKIKFYARVFNILCQPIFIGLCDHPVGLRSEWSAAIASGSSSAPGRVFNILCQPIFYRSM